MRSAINTLLVVLSLMVALLISIPAKASCPIGIENNSVNWIYSKYGDNPYICSNSCKSVLKDISLCLVGNDSCHGDFVTNGEPCPDNDGVVPGGNFPDPDNGGGDGDNGGGDDGGNDSNMPASLKAVWDAAMSHSYEVSDNKILSRVSLESASWSQQTFDKLEQLRTEHFADMDAALNTIQSNSNSIASKMDSINTKVSTIATNTSSAATNLHQINQKIDGISSRDYTDTLDSINAEIGSLQGTIKGEISGLESTINNQTSSLNNTISGVRNDLTNAIYNSATMFGSNNDVKDAVNGLRTGLNDIKDALSEGDYEHRAPEGEIDFGDMPLYQPSAIEELEAETKELEAQYDEKVKQFKNVFSLDESRLKNGEFNNHSTQFTIASGQTITGMSAVFPALVSVSHWIATAILFVAIVAGVRQLGN
ncbi:MULTISPECIES: hypothetical protein [Vibrio]|uniref:hypothetical protein n=1 Tax=Vibrio TaxID=662 RepID=UPI002074FE26|nr:MULTISPECIES: hypothetical protein [Vibrio]USD33951.1 hypothetical protein J8Z27_07660 [Vibrio sp. SCSIO 43186]USD44221.1 hypothetical protein J4N38_08045 [Vibrio sp. SCSIO 43145]USD71075.1 hypothetical protein J4N41_07665 [Vibrio sp. SCSIO 43139]USD95982.1 hypothetical protein CTT30_07770 [Vibrio coralliilyticus]